MSDPAVTLPRHADDFGRVYDLEDPSPYYTALRPSDYRMPAVLAEASKAVGGPLRSARDAGDTPRLLDFACGYGAVGALLRHDLSMAALHARYGERRWRPVDGRRYWEADAAFFAARRAEPVAFEIGGIDVAGAALAYAAAMGFLDRAFHENIVDHAPGDALEGFLEGVDLVVASGAHGEHLPAAFARVLDCCRDTRRPWFLYGPRPDMDWAPLNRLWAERGYRSESLVAGPIRYRKPLSVEERADMLRAARALGHRDEAVMRDGYLLVDVVLARPEADAGNPPVERLRGCVD